MRCLSDALVDWTGDMCRYVLEDKGGGEGVRQEERPSGVVVLDMGTPWKGGGRSSNEEHAKEKKVVNT